MYKLFFNKYVFGAMATVAIITSLIYAYDSWHKKPIREANKETLKCQLDKNNTIAIYDDNIAKLGITISKQGQTIYDLKESIKDINTSNNTKLIECNSKLDELKQEDKIEKVNINSEYFYIKLPA